MNWDIFCVFITVIMINVLIFAAFVKTEYRRFPEYKRQGFSFHIILFSTSAVLTAPAVLTVEMPWFDINTYTSQLGLPAALIFELKYSRVQKPNGYTSKKAMQSLLSYGIENGTSTDDVDIIVIMNEAWADYSLTGNITLPKDPMPFYHLLEENCAKGSMLSSVYSGYTYNTEFEFLTGATMAFLPQYSSPYLQYIHGEMNSVLNDDCFNSYSKTAIPPFYAEEWRRKVNYPLLGFDEFIAGEDFSDNCVEGYNNITGGIIMSFQFNDLFKELPASVTTHLLREIGKGRMHSGLECIYKAGLHSGRIEGVIGTVGFFRCLWCCLFSC